ncbi:uncharacterized protein [Setaria viridis]
MPKEAGPSTLSAIPREPIIVESSPSDEPTSQDSEMGVTTLPTQAEEIRLKEEKDTPKNSLFSFAVAVSDDEEVASCQITLSSIPEGVRAKLQNMHTLHQENIGQLAEDAEPIRQIFNEIKGQVPEDAEEVPTPAAYIKTMQVPVFRALRHMADHSKLEMVHQEEESYKHHAQEVHQQIGLLETSRPSIVNAIDRLKRRRGELAKEMELVVKAITAEEKKLEDLPTVIVDLKQERQSLAHEAIRLHRNTPKVPGSADDDQRVLDAADQVRL